MIGDDRGRSHAGWPSGFSQSTGLRYRVVHVPASSFPWRSKVSSAVWSTTKVFEDSWLQPMGFWSPRLPQETVIIPGRVHGCSHPWVIRRESPSQDSSPGLKSLWSHDDVIVSSSILSKRLMIDCLAFCW